MYKSIINLVQLLGEGLWGCVINLVQLLSKSISTAIREVE